MSKHRKNFEKSSEFSLDMSDTRCTAETDVIETLEPEFAVI